MHSAHGTLVAHELRFDRYIAFAMPSSQSCIIDLEDIVCAVPYESYRTRAVDGVEVMEIGAEVSHFLNKAWALCRHEDTLVLFAHHLPVRPACPSPVQPGSGQD